jgi:hypothetical protein
VAGIERQRTAFNRLRALYRAARWAKLGWSVLVRDMFTCQMCGRLLPSWCATTDSPTVATSPCSGTRTTCGPSAPHPVTRSTSSGWSRQPTCGDAGGQVPDCNM